MESITADEKLSAFKSGNEQKLDFMKLLVTELQNQNPLEPMDHQQMAAQLAQFSQLELAEGMNSNMAEMNSTMTRLNASFQGSLLMAEYNYAKSLLGKEVSFYSDQYDCELTGKVDKLRIDGQSGASVLSVSMNDFELPSGQKLTDTIQIGLIEITGISELDSVL